MLNWVKKKVLLIGNHGFVIYNFRKELIRELLQKGYDVYITLPRDEKVEVMQQWGCHYIETKVDRRGMNPIKDFSLFLRYMRILMQVKPDVVLTYTIKPNLYGGIASRLMRIPYLVNITGLGSGFGRNKWLRMALVILYKWALKGAECVYFQNEEDMRQILGFNMGKGEHKLLPGSGVNLQEFTYTEYPSEKHGPIRFLFVGRIMKDKGIDQYLEAAKQIRAKHPNTAFEIIGFIEKTDAVYKGIFEQYENQGLIRYLGYQSDVKPFLKKAHCLIQPSHSEGLSNVVLEAAATGRPVITSNIPGCREVVEHGVNGYTFKVKDANDLAYQIERFLQLSEEERKRMGAASRKKVENEFDRQIVVDEYMRQIQRLSDPTSIEKGETSWCVDENNSKSTNL